jgi:hypothetical protein
VGGVAREDGEAAAVVLVVAAAVGPALADGGRDAHVEVGRDGDESLVEEGVEFLGEEQAVLDVAAARAEVGLAFRN